MPRPGSSDHDADERFLRLTAGWLRVELTAQLPHRKHRRSAARGGRWTVVQSARSADSADPAAEPLGSGLILWAEGIRAAA